jgi:hypothetical protein
MSKKPYRKIILSKKIVTMLNSRHTMKVNGRVQVQLHDEAILTLAIDFLYPLGGKPR